MVQIGRVKYDNIRIIRRNNRSFRDRRFRNVRLQLWEYARVHTAVSAVIKRKIERTKTLYEIGKRDRGPSPMKNYRENEMYISDCADTHLKFMNAKRGL